MSVTPSRETCLPRGPEFARTLSYGVEGKLPELAFTSASFKHAFKNVPVMESVWATTAIAFVCADLSEMSRGGKYCAFVAKAIRFFLHPAGGTY